MILVILVCLVSWKIFQGDSSEIFNWRKEVPRFAVYVLLITGLIVVSAASLPIVQIPINSNQELWVMPPTAFPFTLQEIRYFSDDSVLCRVVIGWPDGIPIYERGPFHDVSGIVFYEHLVGATVIAAFLYPVAIAILALLYLQSNRKRD